MRRFFIRLCIALCLGLAAAYGLAPSWCEQKQAARQLSHEGIEQSRSLGESALNFFVGSSIAVGEKLWCRQMPTAWEVGGAALEVTGVVSAVLATKAMLVGGRQLARLVVPASVRSTASGAAKWILKLPLLSKRAAYIAAGATFALAVADPWLFATIVGLLPVWAGALVWAAVLLPVLWLVGKVFRLAKPIKAGSKAAARFKAPKSASA